MAAKNAATERAVTAEHSLKAHKFLISCVAEDLKAIEKDRYEVREYNQDGSIRSIEIEHPVKLKGVAPHGN